MDQMQNDHENFVQQKDEKIEALQHRLQEY